MPEEMIVISRTCLFCKKLKTIQVPIIGYRKYISGVFIQHAMPNISASDRELLISGICGTCFDQMFPKEDEGIDTMVIRELTDADYDEINNQEPGNFSG